MATLTRNITKGTSPMGKVELLLRLSVSRNVVVRLKTGLWMKTSKPPTAYMWQRTKGGGA